MIRSLPGAVLVLVVAATAGLAQGPPPPGSTDTWVEPCDAPDADLQSLLANEAFIVHRFGLVYNLDGTIGLPEQFFTQTHGGGSLLCPTSLFYGQVQTQHIPFRSAVQVGPDLLLTAWHSTFDPNALEDYVVVFGFQYRETGDSCLPPSLGSIPSENVYDLVEVVADGQPDLVGGLDFVLLRLDRPAAATYPRVRRSGHGLPGDSLTSIGHPERIPAKVDVAGVAGGLQHFSHREWLEVANIHLLQSNSGSMLYNRSQRILETVARSGGSAIYQFGVSGSPGCLMVGHRDVWSTVNASLRYFAAFIPAFELLVDPLDPVLNVTTVGGGLPNPSTSRTVQAPVTATGPIQYEIVPPPPFEPGQPTLTITPGGPLTGTLAPGAGFTIQEQAHIHGVSCGVYERSYEVRDLTHGFTDVARHVFEVGVSEFTVSAQETRTIRDIALPFDGSVVYTVTNTRPGPVTVVVTASETWVTLNGTGAAGGQPATIELNLAPYGAENVTLGVEGPLTPPSFPHQYGSTISFEYAKGTSCPRTTEPVTRAFDFTLGHEFFSGSTGDVPDDPLSGLEAIAEVDEDFCVGDLNVFVRMNTVPSEQIVATLKSSQVSRLLWNQGTLQFPGPLAALLDDEGAIQPYESLDAFDGTQGGGVWRFVLQDVVPGTAGRLRAWELEFTAGPCS